MLLQDKPAESPALPPAAVAEALRPIADAQRSAGGPPGAPSGRFLIVDALRGLGSFWVVMVHAVAGGHLDALAAAIPLLPWMLRRGELAISIFFVLSGFVIAHSLSRKRLTRSVVGRFILRRSLRLDPPYWASMVLVLAMAWLSSRVVAGKAFVPPTAGELTAHVFYLHELLHWNALQSVYWTLCLEIQFYLTFLALLLLADRLPQRWGLAAVFAAAAGISLLWPTEVLPSAPLEGVFLPLWHAFLLGVFAYWTWHGRMPLWSFLLYAGALTLAGLVYPNAFTILCVATASLLLVAGRCGKMHTWLSWRWLQWIGMISYSIYLIHLPVSGAAFNIGYRLVHRSAASEAGVLAGVIALNLLAAWCFWWLLERPSIALSKRV